MWSVNWSQMEALSLLGGVAFELRSPLAAGLVIQQTQEETTQFLTGTLRACFEGKVSPVSVHVSLSLVSKSLQHNEERRKKGREGEKEMWGEKKSSALMICWAKNVLEKSRIRAGIY